MYCAKGYYKVGNSFMLHVSPPTLFPTLLSHNLFYYFFLLNVCEVHMQHELLVTSILLNHLRYAI